MIINPSHVSLGRLFEQNYLFEVPKYQRYYAWDDEQVNDYIKDIKNVHDNISHGRPIEHFFGGIVCVSKTVEGSTRQQKELIDGQQRITTTMLLINGIIREYLKLQSSESLDEVDRETVTARIRKLKEKYFEYQDEINRRPQTIPKLVLSAADNEYYSALISGLPATEERDSHKRIKKASDLLNGYIHSELEKCSSDLQKMDVLSEIEQIIQTSCTVIFMDCDSRDSAYKLFQVLNDRGAGLTEGDLLKSRTLEALEPYPAQQLRALSDWDSILQDEPKQVESFLRTYYASHCGRRAGRASSLLSIDPTLKLRTNTNNKDFYDLIVDEKKIFPNKYQLYTYAIMVAIVQGAAPDTSVKNLDICQVKNANNEPENFEVAKGLISHLSPDVTNGSDLIKRMNEYADAGIAILQSDYNNNDGELSLDSFID